MKRPVPRAAPALVALSAVALLTACDNTDPVSPQALTVIVNAEPPSVQPGQSSTITVSAFQPEGDPAARAPVKLETTLGRLTRSQFLLNGVGQGSTVLESGAAAGTATVSAIVTVGGTESLGSIEVEILETAPEETPIEAGGGDLDLAHPLRFQAVDRATGDDLGEPIEVAVTLRVRD